MSLAFETTETSRKSVDETDIYTATVATNDSYASYNKFKGYIVIIAAVLISLGSAWHAVFGNYLTYMASFVAAKNIDPNETDVDYIESRYNFYVDQISWTYSIWVTVYSLSMPIGGKIECKFGPRVTTLIGSSFIICGLISTYFVFEYEANAYFLYFSYGALTGSGAGIMYTTPYLVGMRWYEHANSKGFVSGIIFSGISWSSMMLNLLCTHFVNPKNIEIDQKIGFVNEQSVLNNVANSFLQFAVICFCLFLFGIIFIQNPPLYELIRSEASDQTSLIKEKKPEGQLLLKDIIRQPTFWNLFFTILVLPITYVYSQWKALNNSFLGIENDQILSIMASASGVCEGLSRLIWGYLFDSLTAKGKNAYKIMMSGISVLSILLIASWTQLIHIERNSVLIICAFVWLIALYTILSGALTLLPIQAAHLYGTRQGGIVYGLTYCARIGGTLGSMTAITQLRESLGWIMMNNFWVCTQVILFILVLTSKSKQ